MKKAIVMLLMVALFLATAGCENSDDAAALPANAEGSSSTVEVSSTVESSSSTVEVSSTVESSSSTVEVSSTVESSSSMVESSSSLPTSSSLPEIPDGTVPEKENPEEKPNTSGKNETIEIEDRADQRKWEPGVGVSFDTSYSDGMSRKEVFADIQEIVAPYGLIVMESGTIGSGYSDSDGYIALDNSEGPWKFYIYEWRSSSTDTQGSVVMNSALQVFKYFLGSENGANLWGFIDAHLTKQKPKVSDYGITDVGDEINIGTFVFADGTEVAYDQTRMNQFLMFTF